MYLERSFVFSHSKNLMPSFVAAAKPEGRLRGVRKVKESAIRPKKAQLVKKRIKKFRRHHQDRYMRVPVSWRKPKGIDSVVRRKWRGNIKMPNVGYGSCKRTKNVHPDGFKHFVVRNTSDLEVLLMHNKTYAAVIGHAVGVQKRKEIKERAKELDVRVVNSAARVRSEEQQ